MPDLKEGEFLRKCPREVSLWHKAAPVGFGCDVHRGGLGHLLFYDRKYCPHSKWYEKKDCSYVRGWTVSCEVCGYSVTKKQCNGHPVLLDTKEVVVLLGKETHVWDYGYCSVSDVFWVFDKATKEHWRVKVDGAEGWREKTLAYIEKNGFEAKVAILA